MAHLDPARLPQQGRRMADRATLQRLEATILARLSVGSTSSYVARLGADGVPRIARKLGEEAVETVIAALGEDRAALVGEAADLLFHLLVLLAARNVPLSEVLEELESREDVSGLAEKASRPDQGPDEG